MAKTKSAPKGSEATDLKKVKDGRVSKPAKAEPVKAKNVELATKTSKKGEKPEKTSKKSQKAPTPEPESESSESESEGSASASEDESGSEASSASSASASDESESEAVTDSKPAKAAKANVNGAVPKADGVKPAAAKKAEQSSSGESDSDSEGSDESDSEPEAVAPAAKGAKATKPAAAKKSASSDESGSDTSEGTSESESDAELPAKSGITPKGAVVNGDATSDSDAESDEEENEEEAAAPPRAVQKRKAEEAEQSTAKKAKTSEASGSSNLFVGNLSWNVDDDWLKREFGAHGNVIGARVMTDRNSGRSKGFGYVDFATPEDAKKAHDAMKDQEIDGRVANVDYAQGKKNDGPDFKQKANDRGSKFGDSQSPPSDTLFIANLSFDTSADGLREMLESYGSITRVSLPTHADSGQPKGFGYVGFSSIDEAKAAHEALTGQTVDGRPVRVDFAAPRPEQGQSFGGRGRGGFDRGGGRGRGGFDRGGGRGRGFGGGRGGDRGGRGGRGGSYNRGGVGDFSGKKVSF